MLAHHIVELDNLTFDDIVFSCDDKRLDHLQKGIFICTSPFNKSILEVCNHDPLWREEYAFVKQANVLKIRKVNRNTRDHYQKDFVDKIDEPMLKKFLEKLETEFTKSIMIVTPNSINNSFKEISTHPQNTQILACSKKCISYTLDLMTLDEEDKKILARLLTQYPLSYFTNKISYKVFLNDDIYQIKLKQPIIRRPKKKYADKTIEIVGQTLGQGSFGQVCEIEASLDPVDLKTFSLKIKPKDEQRVVKFLRVTTAWEPANTTHGSFCYLVGTAKEKILNETNNMKQIKPTFKTKDPVFSASNVSFFVMKRIEGDDLEDHKKNIASKKIAFSLKDHIEIILGVLKEVDDVHKKGFLHRDIKPANILVDAVKRNVTLVDYSFASKIEDLLTKKTPCGTPGFMAPEIRKNEQAIYSEKSDIYAVGKTLRDLWEVCLAHISAEEKKYLQQYAQKIRNAIDYLDIDNDQKRSSLSEAIQLFENVYSSLSLSSNLHL